MNVLIVDDSPAIRGVLKRVLRNTMASTTEDIYEASDGVEALASLKEHTIGLVLSDVNMPNMDGIQLLRQIRSNREYDRVPVVMVTTDSSQHRVMEAVELGANGYIRKPFTPDIVKDKLASIL